MRTTKFRGKRTDKNEWVYGDLTKGEEDGLYRIHTSFSIRHYVLPETVGQYWRTVNKQDLYDGDVFESRMFDDKPKWVVQYREDEGCFCITHPEELHLKFVYPWQKPDKKWWEEFGKDLYVIGNIHDNPELIHN